MIDNIPAMKILHCRPFLEHDQAVNATRLIVCLKVSCSVGLWSNIKSRTLPQPSMPDMPATK